MRYLKRKILALFLCGGMLCLPLGVAAKELIKNGKQCEYYTNGNLKIENVFKKGLLVRRRNYYKNGKLMSEYRYKNGEEYLRRTFYENGQLQSIWTKKSGVTKYYYKSGGLRLVVDHNKGKPKHPSSYLFGDQ